MKLRLIACTDLRRRRRIAGEVAANASKCPTSELPTANYELPTPAHFRILLPSRFGQRLRVYWTDTPIHFIDFEGSVTSGVLEFGVVTLRGGRIAETRTRFCRPSGRIKPEDEAVHGLRAEALAPYAPFMEEFDYFATLREQGPLAAHYATAENTMLKAIWPYVRKVPDFARPGQTLMDWGPWIDTGRLYLDNFKGVAGGRLEQLVSVFGLQDELTDLAAQHAPPDRRRYHCALYDALAGALLLRSLEGRLHRGPLTLLWLLHASTANPQKREGLRQGDLFE